MISISTIGQIIYMSIRFKMSKNANIGEKARDGILLIDFFIIQMMYLDVRFE